MYHLKVGIQDMKNHVLSVAGLCIICIQLIAGDILFSADIGGHADFASNHAQLNADPHNIPASSESHNWPIIIYYCLNNSHSGDWVRRNQNGVIGISCFQRSTGSTDEGTLLYKTIRPDGSENIDSVASGRRLETSVLMFDSLLNPNIFLAQSNDLDQIIERYYKNQEDQWQSDTIVHFNNYGGKFIYEMSAATGPDHSFHLLILKTRSNIDSDDFMDAWLDSYLFHITNQNGLWETEVIHTYNMAWTMDMYVKCSGRQDIQVDRNGFVHVTFSEQINGGDYPSRLLYATNKTGHWQREVALGFDPGSHDDAGWYPSLSLDTAGVPHIACMYVDRVPTLSATSCKLLFLTRVGQDDWRSEIVAEFDDGYCGSDGHDYTGALNQLVFDRNNTPHLVFSDVASTHYPATQALSVGNIRYGVLENGTWDITTIYRQPLPTDFLHAVEMYGMCLVLSDDTDSVHVIGQELKITGENLYSTRLLHITWADPSTGVDDEMGGLPPHRLELPQNYPNPFNQATTVKYELPRRSHVTVGVFNVLGQPVRTLVDREESAGVYTVTWDGTTASGQPAATGVYLYRLQSGDYVETKKMLLLK